MSALDQTIRRALVALLIAGGAIAPAASGEAEVRHGAWHECLSRNFAVEARLAGRDLAADAAFTACRDAEHAYLVALEASPLLDEDDLARARPELAGRMRARLVGSR